MSPILSPSPPAHPGRHSIAQPRPKRAAGGGHRVALTQGTPLVPGGPSPRSRPEVRAPAHRHPPPALEDPSVAASRPGRAPSR